MVEQRARVKLVDSSPFLYHIDKTLRIVATNCCHLYGLDYIRYMLIRCHLSTQWSESSLDHAISPQPMMTGCQFKAYEQTSMKNSNNKGIGKCRL